MRFQLISNFRTVVKHDDGSLQRIQHNPPLSTAAILDFLQMLTTEPRDLQESQPNGTDCDAAETEPRPGRAAAVVPPQEIVGFFQNATGCHPLRVASATTILQVVTGRAPAHLGRFAVRLYLEAARKVGFGTTVNPVQDDASLRRLFAKGVRAVLPELRLRYQHQNPDAANDTPYSLRLLGSFGNPAGMTPKGGSQAAGSTPTVTGDEGSSAPTCPAAATEPQSDNSSKSRSYNEVMAQTVRGVLGLGRLALLQQPDRDQSSLDFARIASLASDIRRAVTGNNRGADIRPQTAMRILGRARRKNLVLLNTIGMSDEELFGQFRNLTDIDTQALNG